MPESFIHFNVDASDLENYGSVVEGRVSAAFLLAAKAVEINLPPIIQNVFLQATVGLQSRDWPEEYTAHLLSVVADMPIEVIGTTAGITVFYDLDSLGTWEDLRLSYHFGAYLAGGGQVTLPYTGQPLKNESREKRHNWLWEHVMNDSTKWDITINARLEQWANRAPEWLLLQYGGPDFAPHPVIEELLERSRLEVEKIAMYFIAQSVDEGKLGDIIQEDIGQQSFRNLRTGQYASQQPQAYM